ncbi:hypothetical protein DPMN_039220 [Dreissena polymorpha]|uniref:Uncharacterized protein n=1 Tax=Dreissena polymorpha TaxID=45954 RepID=A0A9D4RNY9_DREPO|nr:hypothetical protein DPMN_039220 [Dreissena polymorpha]
MFLPTFMTNEHPGSHEKCPPSDIIVTNRLTKFHDDWTINKASRVLTRKMPRALGGHVFPPTGTIFERIQDIIGIHLVTKFHDDRTINVASGVLIMKNAQPLNIIGTNLLTKFHEDRKINVASRVLTVMNLLTKKNAPLHCSNVFPANVTIFKLIQDIIETNLLTKFREDWTINVASWVLTRTNLLTKFREDRKINVASRVLTRKNAPPQAAIFFNQPASFLNSKNAPPLGSHVFPANVIIFELIQNITETNLLTKLHEDWTINEASRVLTLQMLTPHNGRQTTALTLCSEELKSMCLLERKF